MLPSSQTFAQLKTSPVAVRAGKAGVLKTQASPRYCIKQRPEKGAKSTDMDVPTSVGAQIST